MQLHLLGDGGIDIAFESVYWTRCISTFSVLSDDAGLHYRQVLETWYWIEWKLDLRDLLMRVEVMWTRFRQRMEAVHEKKSPFAPDCRLTGCAARYQSQVR